MDPTVWGPSLRFLQFRDLTYLDEGVDLRPTEVPRGPDALPAAIGMFEDVLDDAGLRGAGQKDLRNFASYCLGQTAIGALLQGLALLPPHMKAQLSRESRIIADLAAQSNTPAPQRI